MSNSERVGRRVSDYGASYLSGQATVKDDLQSIFSLNREIGAAVYTVLKHLETIKGSLSDDDVSKNLEDIMKGLEVIKQEHNAMFKKLETLETLKQSSVDMSEYNKERVELEDARQEHFDRIVKIIYANNGYDEKGNKIPDAIMQFSRWSKIIHSAFWSFITTLVLSGVFYLVVKGREELAAEKSRAVIELIDKTKEVLQKQEEQLEATERATKKK
jgi:hypothetical protein